MSEQPAALTQEFAPDIGMPPPEVEAPPDEERIGGWTTEGIVWSIVGVLFLVWAIWCFVDNGTAFVALTGAGLAKGAVVALSALGFVMIIKATGIANFAQGDLITLGAFLGFWATDKTGIAKNGLEFSLLIGYIIALVLMFLIGLAIERVAYAPLKGRDIHVVVIATLGVAIIIRTLLAIWQGTEPRFLQSWFNTGQDLENFGPFGKGTLTINIGLLGIHDAVIAAQRVIIMGANAIEKAGSHDYPKLNKAMASTVYDGVCDYKIDKNNVLAQSVTIYKYNSDGSKKLLKIYPLDYVPSDELATTTTAAPAG